MIDARRTAGVAPHELERISMTPLSSGESVDQRPFNLYCEVQSVAPGIGIPEELRQLKQADPSTVSMYQYDQISGQPTRVAVLKNPNGSQLSAFIMFERTAELSRHSGEYLHRLLIVRYEH